MFTIATRRRPTSIHHFLLLLQTRYTVVFYRTVSWTSNLWSRPVELHNSTVTQLQASVVLLSKTQQFSRQCWYKFAFTGQMKLFGHVQLLSTQSKGRQPQCEIKQYKRQQENNTSKHKKESKLWNKLHSVFSHCVSYLLLLPLSQLSALRSTVLLSWSGVSEGLHNPGLRGDTLPTNLPFKTN